MAQLSRLRSCEVHGTVRDPSSIRPYFPQSFPVSIHDKVDVACFASVTQVFKEVRPELVINCIGIIKQNPLAGKPIPCITINALFPHMLAELCCTTGARLIHISTDCVFDGQKGHYTEEDATNAIDLYGRTKALGEVSAPGCVTLRTSIIGHELGSSYGLVDWFLEQTGSVKGYSRAIFSGIPTIELANIVISHVLPNNALHGLYHVAAQPISKFDLLTIIASIYGVSISITPSPDVCVDRSLVADRFNQQSGYSPASWLELVKYMYDDFKSSLHYDHRRTSIK